MRVIFCWLFTLDGQLVCNRGMKSTIKSLNSVLFPVTTETCKPSYTCGVATVKVKYQSETGQGKIGGCIPKNVCSTAAGCSVAIRFLPTGATFQECKVFHINIYLPSFCPFFFVLIFYMNSCSDLNYNLITNTWKNRNTRNDKRCAAGLNSTIKNTKTVIIMNDKRCAAGLNSTIKNSKTVIIILFWSLL